MGKGIVRIFYKMDVRQYAKIPVFVEEDHHDVLPHIFRSVGAKYLPVQGNVMIHFDSHPDLLLPMNIKAQDMNNVHNLYEKLSIENWILPACYLGVIDTIIWVKPPWSNQIQDGHYNFKIGKQRGTGKVLISCLQNYFIAEGLICDPNEMENTKEINLYVLQISNFASINALREAIVGKPIILDIDLDFFSTRNPFLNIYQEIQLYSTLKQIYLFQALPNDFRTGSAQSRFTIKPKSKRIVRQFRRFDHIFSQWSTFRILRRTRQRLYSTIPKHSKIN